MDYQWGTFTAGISTDLTSQYKMSTDTITACIICQNSEKTLEKCLQSISSWANEIIILDGGSTDNTVNIGKKHTNKIYVSKWPNDFSKQRNILIKKVKTEWMFAIDADEHVKKRFGKKIRQFLTFANKYKYDLIWLPRNWLFKENKIIKGHWLFWPDPQARIARMKQIPFFSGKIHEKLMLETESKSFLIHHDDLALCHEKLATSDFKSRKADVELRNKIDFGGAHTIQLLPELFFDRLGLELFSN